MWRQLLLVTVFLSVCTELISSQKRKKVVECPAVCEPEKCPNIGPIKLSDCPKPYVKKDHCDCCERCEIRHVTTTISPLKRDEVCEKVTCPKKKLCMLNMQGLPVCKCPTLDLCKDAPGRKKGRVCGSDGITYPSRCHVKVASCQEDKKIRAVGRGECPAESVEEELPELPTAQLSEVEVWLEELQPETVAEQERKGKRGSRRDKKRERKRLQARRQRKKKNRQSKQERQQLQRVFQL